MLPGKHKGCVVVCIAFVFLFAATPVMYRRYTWAKKRMCVSHIKTISYGIWLYHGENGVLPDHYGRLIYVYCVAPEICVCPSANRATPLHVPFHDVQTPEGDRILAGFGPEHSDYAYVAGLTPKMARDAFVAPMKDWLLVFEKEANHGGERNAAPMDNRVLSLTDDEFRERLERTLREARKAGFNPRIWGYAPGEGPLSPEERKARGGEGR